MGIKSKPSWYIPESLVTPESDYFSRRKFLQTLGGLGALSLPARSWAAENKYQDLKKLITPEKYATNYNNFYEFSLNKEDVAKKVESWKLKSWQVEITGLVDKPLKLDVADLIKLAGGTEDRIYRFRCVEAWSMVLPWQGFQLSKLLDKVGVKSTAKYVHFQTFSDRSIGTNMKKLPHYPWPYSEGLRLDEARHPLTLLATGLYGKPLPKQNGAPIRLVVPWKYGFKSIKSIVKIELTDKEPSTLWRWLAPDEYGFYANVNPTVSHPRWSQARERVIDGKIFPSKIDTLMFNGYEQEVASLYKGMDLKKFY